MRIVVPEIARLRTAGHVVSAGQKGKVAGHGMMDEKASAIVERRSEPMPAVWQVEYTRKSGVAIYVCGSWFPGLSDCRRR
jgi:hypothetical protein